MRLELTIPNMAMCSAILSGAGRIQDWAREISLWRPASLGRPEEHETDLRVACDVVDRFSGERISIQEQWAAGLRLMAERYPRKLAELLAGGGDAATGDVLIQLAAFGELRYS